MTDQLDIYLPPVCGVEGCDVLGPFATDDGPRCFEHSGLASDVSADYAPALEASIGAVERGKGKARKPKDVPPDDANDVAARALCALILQATADALTADAPTMERAIIQLAADLPSPLEVAMAVLFATTALAGTAGLTDQEVFVIGTAFEDQAVEESEAP